MTTVALYARVSSRRQEQNNTIASQIAELERKIAADGHKLLDEYKFKDDGCSGSNLEREGLKKLLRKVAEGKINKIYIHSLDRLSRDGRDQRTVIDECKRAEVKIISLDCKIDDTPSSNLLVDVKGALARHELGVISERSMRGKLHAAREGRVSVMGNAPFGYECIKHVEREKTKFKINEEEAKIVRNLFEWVGQERVSLKETARRLKEEYIATPKGKGIWHPSTIRRMLRNPAYKGLAAFCKTKVGPIRKEGRATWKVRKKSYSVYANNQENWIYIEIPSIIEEELFNIVQKQLVENRKRARMQRSGRKHLLQGLVVCQYCKYTYYVVKGGRSYYRCPGTDGNRFGGTKVCNSKSIRADILEKVIWEEMKMVLKEPETIAKEYQLRISKHKNKQPNDELEKEISKLEQGIERLAYVYARGHIAKEKYDLEVEGMEKELKGIRNQKEEMVDEKRLKEELDFITSNVESFSSEVESEVDQAGWETKLDIIRKLVQHIEIDDDNVHIVFRLKELALERQKKNVQHCIRIPVSRTGMTSNQAANRLNLKIRLSDNKVINCNLRVQGEHLAYSALAVAAAMQSLGLDLSKLPLALENFSVTKGRGNVHKVKYNGKYIYLIDDSYNASPASMKAAIKTLSTYSDQRKVALLGDMLELGDESIGFHTDLVKVITENNIDKVYTVGKFMLELHKLLPDNIKDVHFNDPNQLKNGLANIIQNNDVILVKGSRGMKMDLIMQEFIIEY